MIRMLDYSPKKRLHQSVLVVEDDAITRSALKRLLSAAGYVVQTAGSAEVAMELLEHKDIDPDLALVDLDFQYLLNVMGRHAVSH
jgi:two-component system, cell cycle sensor histidine kinase and response regulator CckA